MKKEKIEKELIKLIVQFAPEGKQKDISLSWSLRDDLGLDSIKMFSLITVLDQKLNFDSIEATANVDLTEVNTCQDVLELVLEYQKNS